MNRSIKQLIKDLFSNPDGTGSTKRTAGWILILSSLIYGIASTYIDATDVSVFSMVFITTMSAGLSCFGLSSIDTISLQKINKSKDGNDFTFNSTNSNPCELGNTNNNNNIQN